MEQELLKEMREYYATINATDSLYAAWAKRHGLSYHALFTLYAIYHSTGNCYQRAICEEWLMPKQTVNSVLKQLEGQGYISYTPDKADRRNKIISLTPAGRRYAQPILEALDQLELTVLEKMGVQERRAMVAGYTTFFKLLQQTIQEETNHEIASHPVLE